ncbi:tripartite tricarboxylate transporter substrate binding protein [Caenimonas aquaedulcis]|uniref:Tripartite tricarboxylate transporter substrate binding protein n=1 Tax=Caenimonas aquaedulcis TaxID=2793270 RepID=A0A931H8D0_9BURK|nr:tripartite tricarboxylate transporter substrate binding protein [Caenimonas aquaedulcis]MBG9390594.1 tripartite tricarboxylate transporter substrate binding protein [Caenimonas aquaedulcis]
MTPLRCLAIAALCALAASVQAQPDTAGYPNRPITIVTPTTGGAADAVARTLSASMSKSLGVGVVVASRPGAGGNVASESVAHAAPDGYTLLLALGSMLTVNPALYAKPNFNPVSDFSPIGLVATTPYVLAVNPTVPAKNVRELVAHANAARDPLFYSSPGNGTPNHILGVLFNTAAGTKLQHVPYKTTGAATTDVISGQVSMTFGSMPSVLPFLRSGQLRGIAVSTAQRSAFAPGVPAMSETLPGFAFDAWYALLAPARTPKPVMDKLVGAVEQALKDKEVRAAYAQQNLDVATGTPAELSALIGQDLARWTAVIKSNDIKPD